MTNDSICLATMFMWFGASFAYLVITISRLGN